MRSRACAALACALAATAIHAAPAAHQMRVRIDPVTRALEGQDSIRLDSRRSATLLLSARMRIDSLAVDGRRVTIQARQAQGLQRIALPAARRIDLNWSGELAPLEHGLDHRGTLSMREPASSAQGTYLPAASAWYPAVEASLERYRLDLDLPADQRGLAPGTLTAETVSDGRYRAHFEFRQPAEGISLMAGPYRIEERRLRTAAGSQVRLRTYFHAEIAELAPAYLDSVAGYLDQYERWIGPYPFSEFSIVSSPTPTGFGMPGLTYLGIEVLRLPFIRATSLGHEVLHNWWGNGVYPDYARGNWSEGLTTFMADYAYREREGPAAASAARLAWLRDYAALAQSDDYPLARFTSRIHGASQIVGYNKAAMLFFMLRDAIGKIAFDAGLRRFWREQRFRIASWTQLRRAFEQASGKDLAGFFEQWLERSGAPRVHIASAHTQAGASGWRLNLTLDQEAPAYALSLPLTIRTTGGEITRRIELSREHENIQLELAAQPLAVLLDPELRVLRRLAPAEAPPILREAMLATGPALATPDADAALQAAAAQVAAAFFERPPTAGQAAAATLVAGLHADIDAWLAREHLAPRPRELAATRGSAQVWAARTPEGRLLVLVSVRDAPALAALVRPLPHYGQQSYLVFDGARVIERGSWPSQAQVWELEQKSSTR